MIGPILGLVALDRAVTLSSAHWSWAAREVPEGLLDPYRVEALLRSATPGPQNVFILGDSVIDSALDVSSLNEALEDEGRRYTILRIGGSATATFGFLANQLVAVKPAAILLVVNGAALRSQAFTGQVYNYDVRVVRDLFTWREILADPGFHLAGLADQANIVFRQRYALQRALAVRLGLSSWDRVRLEQTRLQLEISQALGPLRRWVRNRQGDTYPNPNTRAIALLARKAHENGIRLVLIEAPFHPHMKLLVGEPRLQALRAEIARLVREENIEYLRAEDMLALDVDDFRDHTHLNATGKKRFTEAAIRIFPRMVH
ncbi:MAG: hypothetical protein Q8R92_00110 [Deltaproteobacteria bacterium]|nr:hypothetical protein [Deltaproteobacteria bacterium]